MLIKIMNEIGYTLLENLRAVQTAGRTGIGQNSSKQTSIKTAALSRHGSRGLVRQGLGPEVEPTGRKSGTGISHQNTHALKGTGFKRAGRKRGRRQTRTFLLGLRFSRTTGLSILKLLRCEILEERRRTLSQN